MATTSEAARNGVTPGLTPSQTVGPYLAIGLTWPDGEYAVPKDTPGAIRISGVVYDGHGLPVPDGMVETWQADPDGRFHHPDDPRGTTTWPGWAPGFGGFARSSTKDGGRFTVVTVKPGPVPGPGGRLQAPHLDVSVFARGLLDRVVTRIYFPEETALDGPGGHAEDPVLRAVATDRRPTLVAQADGEGGYRFDIRLQGENETVFFAV